MTLVWQLAWRYLRGKRAGNVVPVLSRISMVAIAVGSCAMIVLFSVFNGFEDLIKDLYKAFYPEIKVSPVQGKFFSASDQQLQALRGITGIKAVTTVLEDNVLLNNDAEQMVATLKGIDENYFKVNTIKPYIYDGADTVSINPEPTALMGLYIADQMGVSVNSPFVKLTVYYPNTTVSNLSLNPTEAFQSLVLRPAGVFRVQDEFDRKYILAPLPLVQQLFLQQGKYSSVEVSLLPGADPEDVQTQVSKLFGKDYHVESRYEQNRTMYLVMQTEKWAVYAILLLVLLIASVNMVGALTLLVLEKNKDLAILKAMGSQPRAIRSIFITEGVLWSLIGGMIGLLVGVGLCLGQQHYQWIKLQGTFIIDAYPVALHLPDVLVVLATVLMVGLLAALYPAIRATRVEDPTLKSA